MPKLKIVRNLPTYVRPETPLQKLEREVKEFGPEYGARRLRSDPLALKLHQDIVSRLIEEMVR